MGKQDRPDWAQRIVAERTARDWSQQDFIDVLQRASSQPLPSDQSMLRSVKGWEAGDHKPGQDYRRLIAEAFGTVTLAIFGERPTLDRDHYDPILTLELIERIQASDIDSTALDRIEQQVDDLCTNYSWADPHQLLGETSMWLRHLNQLRSAKTTIAEHQRILELAGWLTLLLGNTQLRCRRSQGRRGRPTSSPQTWPGDRQHRDRSMGS